MSYSFLDASSSVQSADSSVVSGTVQRPRIDIGSVLGAVPVTFSTASLVSGVTSVLTGTSSTLVLAAPPSAQRNYITQLLVSNGAATGTFVNIVDNGTVIYSGYAAASGGGFSASFPTPLKQPTSVLALYAAPVSQASIIVATSGYTAS